MNVRLGLVLVTGERRVGSLCLVPTIQTDLFLLRIRRCGVADTAVFVIAMVVIVDVVEQVGWGGFLWYVHDAVSTRLVHGPAHLHA